MPTRAMSEMPATLFALQAYMNDRLSRAAGKYIAPFITAFAEAPAGYDKNAKKKKEEDKSIWLVWKYEVRAKLRCSCVQHSVMPAQ